MTRPRLAQRVGSFGFTLIELMIVVAIVGILAAIAIPQYQDYLTRSRWSDNLQSIAQLKQAIAECLQNNGSDLSQCDSAGDLLDDGYVPVGFVLPTPRYANQVSIIATTAAIAIPGTTLGGDCTVTLTPSTGGSAQAITWQFTNGGVGCNRSKTGVGT